MPVQRGICRIRVRSLSVLPCFRGSYRVGYPIASAGRKTMFLSSAAALIGLSALIAVRVIPPTLAALYLCH